MPLSTQSAPRSALMGRYAECSLGGSVVVLCFDWEVTFETETADATAHGDYWKVTLAMESGWTFRARGYVTPASTAHYGNSMWSSSAIPANVTVAGFSGPVTATWAAAGTKIFEGTGVPIRWNLTAPMAMAEQEWEIRGTGAPSVGV
jgi:hypothetical protein